MFYYYTLHYHWGTGYYCLDPMFIISNDSKSISDFIYACLTVTDDTIVLRSKLDTNRIRFQYSLHKFRYEYNFDFVSYPFRWRLFLIHSPWNMLVTILFDDTIYSNSLSNRYGFEYIPQFILMGVVGYSVVGHEAL